MIIRAQGNKIKPYNPTVCPLIYLRSLIDQKAKKCFLINLLNISDGKFVHEVYIEGLESIY